MSRRSSTFRDSIHLEKGLSIEDPKKSVYERRGAFHFLPVHSSNDLVIGSWYFVWGSLFFLIIALIPLVNIPLHFWDDNEFGNVSKTEIIILSVFFIVSAVFFALGSYAFVLALRDEEHKRPAIFEGSYHVGTDEQLGAWLYFVAMCPYPPFAAVYLYDSPSDLAYWAAFVAALLCLFAVFLFVRACYPGGSKDFNICSCIPRLLRHCFGDKSCLARHLQNDWLLGCWIFFIGSFLFTIAFLLEMGKSILQHSNGTVFITALDAFDFLLFTLGCAYFCAGSYPERPIEAAIINDNPLARKETSGGLEM